MEQAGFAFRPLYLDEQKDEVAAAGPFLVPLPDRKAGRRLSGLIGDKPAIVWWSWPDRGEETQEAIFRHLRTINMAEIPAGPADPDDPAIIAEARAAEQGAAHMPDGHDHDGHDHAGHAPERYDLVLFRHGDPNVMALLLPLLDFAQVARLFGEATGIVIDSPDAGGVRTYARPADLPERPRGWLRIGKDQYDAMSGKRIVASRLRIMAGLRESLGDTIADRDDRTLYRLVSDAEAQGGKLGIVSEQSHFYWAYLFLATDGAIVDIPDIEYELRAHQGSSDAGVEHLFLEFQKQF